MINEQFLPFMPAMKSSSGFCQYLVQDFLADLPFSALVPRHKIILTNVKLGTMVIKYSLCMQSVKYAQIIHNPLVLNTLKQLLYFIKT